MCFISVNKSVLIYSCRLFIINIKKLNKEQIIGIFLLKGTVCLHEIFDLSFFSSKVSSWSPDSYPNFFYECKFEFAEIFEFECH
jgi:hypothetical protein